MSSIKTTHVEFDRAEAALAYDKQGNSNMHCDEHKEEPGHWSELKQGDKAKSECCRQNKLDMCLF